MHKPSWIKNHWVELQNIFRLHLPLPYTYKEHIYRYSCDILSDGSAVTCQNNKRHPDCDSSDMVFPLQRRFRFYILPSQCLLEEKQQPI